MPDTPPDDEPVATAGGDDSLARRIVAQLQAAAREHPAPRRGSRRTRPPAIASGARPDDRDPQLAEDVLRRWLRDAGWAEQAAAGSLVARWPEIAGAEVADHVTPEITAEGDLLLRADSTAWATQLQLLLPDLRRRLHETVGPGVVGQIRVLGPTPPRRAPGSRRVPGPGPRDTYG